MKSTFFAFNRIWQPTPAANREHATWDLVAPWGQHPNVEGTQEITAESCAGMIAALNAMDDKHKGEWPGLPIYNEHPDAGEISRKMGWTDTTRIGHFWRAEAKGDGLYVLRSWNDRGAVNAANGIRPYPSGYWNYKVKGRGVIVPTRFKSIGMTEDPNITGTGAWNSSSEMDETGDDATTNTTSTMEIKHIAALLGMTDPDKATQQSVEAELTAMKSKCDSACANSSALNTATGQLVTEKQRADAEKLRADKAEGEKTALNALLTKSALNTAIETGRITKGESKVWEDKFALNVTTTHEDLFKIKPRANASVALNRSQQVQRELTQREAQQEVSTLASAVLSKHRGNIQAALNAVCKDPANKALVDTANGVHAADSE